MKPCKHTLLKGENMKTFRAGSNECGLTLVEIVITLAILGAVITAIYSFYLTGLKGWNRSVDRMEYQQSARIAVDRVVNELLTAQEVEIRDNNQRAIYYVIDKDGSPALFRLRLTGDQLALERRDSHHLSYNVVALGLKDLLFFIDEKNNVHITVITGDDNCEFTVTASVRPRNIF